MAQKNRSGQRKRRAYDQARDARRTGQSTPRSSSDLGYSGYSGYSSGGHPITNPNYDPDAPRPSRYSEHSVNYGSYPDNSIQFPTGGRSGQNGQRPRSGSNSPSGQRRTGTANRNRRPASGQNRSRNHPNQNARQNGQTRNGQRMRPVQGQNIRHDPARREGRKKRKLTRAAIRRQRAIRRLTALAMLLCVIGAGVYLTVTMLFKISTIQVRTADGVVQEVGGYTSDQILQALDVHTEENIFSFDPGAKAAALEKVFPMLEDIKVVRDYPSTVVVQVTEAQPAWAMQTSSGWLTLSASLKILSSDSAQPAGLHTLYGGEPVSTQPGDQLTFETEAAADSAASDSSASSTAEPEPDKRLESLNTLLTALDTAGLSGDVTRIEFADVDEMTFLYQDRISVRLGTLNELDYKLKLAKHVLLNEDGKGCADTDTGVLDFTHISMSSTRKFTFAQGEPELPSGYIVPEPAETAPEETPTEETTGETSEGADGTIPAEGDAAADTAADTPADTAAAAPEAGQTAEAAQEETTPAEETAPAEGNADQPQTTQ